MELEFLSFQVLVTFLLLLLVLLIIGKRGQHNKPSTPNLPPGPWKLPFIGNAHQLIGVLPHHGLRDLAKKHGPLMHLKLGEVSTVVVSSAKLAKEVMKSHDVIFASRPQELLSAKRVQSYRPIREQEVMNVIKWIGSRAESPINISQKVTSCIFSITARAAFGNQCKDQEAFKDVMRQVGDDASGFNVEDVFPSYKLLHVISGMKPKLEKLQKQADQILENIIREHIEATTVKGDDAEIHEDLVDVLLKFHNNYGGKELSLTIDNIKAVIMDIFTAGSDTAASTIVWAMSELIKHPRIMKKAQDEVREVFNRTQQVNETGIRDMKYLKLVIQETLRLHPALPLLLPRECGETCKINGYEIPVKTKVMVNVWAIGRDPDYWSEPETFNPERFLGKPIEYQGTNFDYIPFGAGRRICPGVLYGVANVELQLAMLLYHFDWTLPNGMKNEDLDMTEEFGVVVHRKQDLLLIPSPYPPPSPTVANSKNRNIA